MKTLAILGVALWELIWAAASVIFALVFGLSVVAVVVSYTALVRALTFYYVWAWLIAPIGLPVIPVSVIGGVCLIIAVIKINIEPDKSGPKDGRVLYEALVKVTVFHGMMVLSAAFLAFVWPDYAHWIGAS